MDTIWTLISVLSDLSEKVDVFGLYIRSVRFVLSCSGIHPANP